RYPSSPTVVLDQVLAEDGKSLLPPKGARSKIVEPAPNCYLVYPGELHHGVVTRPAPDMPQGLRLSLVVNYWDRRPMPPVCRHDHGSIYAPLALAAWGAVGALSG